MIIYNVTVKVDDEIVDDWLKWMQDVHIPDVLRTGCFVDHDIMQLKFPKDDEGQTFAIQYSCESMNDLDTYHRSHATALQKDHIARYGDRVVAFRTILERFDKPA